MVEPSDPDVVRAVELVDVTGFGGPQETVEGLGVYFHRDHFPRNDPGYRLVSER